MNEGRTVFAQLLDFLPQYEFDKCVARYHGNFRVRKLPTYEQFLVLAFAQLTWRESLRDIQTCLTAFGPKLYHAGIRQPIARTTLADANEHRDWRIFADFAQVLIRQAATLYADEPFRFELQAALMRWTPPPLTSVCRSFREPRFDSKTPISQALAPLPATPPSPNTENHQCLIGF